MTSTDDDWVFGYLEPRHRGTPDHYYALRKCQRSLFWKWEVIKVYKNSRPDHLMSKHLSMKSAHATATILNNGRKV